MKLLGMKFLTNNLMAENDSAAISSALWIILLLSAP